MTIPFGPRITDKMPSGLITVDREGRITGHNPACERIFLETLVTSDLLRDLVRESQALQDLLNRCLEAGEVFTRVQFNVPTRSGVDKRIGINLSPITSPEGRIEGAICLLSDLTEIVELQNQIKLKENFAALGEMSASIAHEFKNSIATIVGYAQMSKTEPDVNTLQSYAGEIHKESQALSNMVTDFLNFAKPVQPSMFDLDLVELLDSVITDLKSRRPGGYDVQFHSSGEAVVPCDATLMRQSFINLLINATEAIDGKGTISVTVEAPEARNHIRVVVQDTGHGIPEHLIPKIFFPFFTTKTHGTGLGLSLVQKIVLAHNGRIEVHSTEGVGTSFTITLPKK
ncbi:MAG TPA: ATP-binding protein [Terriglobia bacterium]|nr:ATP-binding protein [Terriglobia bacterium]